MGHKKGGMKNYGYGKKSHKSAGGSKMPKGYKNK